MLLNGKVALWVMSNKRHNHPKNNILVGGFSFHSSHEQLMNKKHLALNNLVQEQVIKG